MSVSGSTVFFVEEVMEQIGIDMDWEIESEQIRELAHLISTREMSPEDAFSILMDASNALEERELALYEMTRESVSEHLEDAICYGDFGWGEGTYPRDEEVADMLLEMGMEQVYRADGGPLPERCPGCDLSPRDHTELSHKLVSIEADLMRMKYRVECAEKNALVYKIKLRKLQE